MKFYKMNGAGNDFVFIEDFDNKIEDECALAKKLCDRHFGIGADGLVIVRRSEEAKAKMVIINADGSRANMCGNAIRCFGKYVYEHKIVTETKFPVETGDGIKVIEIILEDEKVKFVKVYMGKPSFDAKDIPLNEVPNLIDTKIEVGGNNYKVTTLLMGVPHTVIFEEERKYDVISEGPALEKYRLFKEGSNINFVKIIDDTHIKVDTWERGAGATLACGTGCSASVVVCKKLGLVDNEKEIHVKAPGGELVIEVTEDGVYMKGNAEISFEGIINL